MESQTPTDPPAASDGAQDTPGAFSIPLRQLTLGAPLRWLGLGWRDFMRSPAVGLFYGACFVLMGWLLLYVYQHAPAYVLALSAGFLLVGPFMCLGLYQASWHLERGEQPDLGDSLLAWERKASALAIFGFVLLVLEMLWARASLVIFAVSFDGMPDLQGSLSALASPDNLGFIVTYLLVGAVFAGLIFAISVVSIPMILDRQTDAITAGLTSLRLVLTQPLVMLCWGALITVIIGAAMLPWLLGLLVAGPLLGYASWHAYRDAVGDVAAEAPPTPHAQG
ncbi:MAG: DUF2189 domain-containing protein [Proteobacteria bacterium]|nr:DUF2189 domain-containing protein [Pseudomonadota bacterium]